MSMAVLWIVIVTTVNSVVITAFVLCKYSDHKMWKRNKTEWWYKKGACMNCGHNSIPHYHAFNIEYIVGSIRNTAFECKRCGYQFVVNSREGLKE